MTFVIATICMTAMAVGPRLSVLLVAVGDADKDYRGCVQPISMRLPEDIINKIK